MKKIALVIVTYNRLLDLKVLLGKLPSQTERDFDIIVVNNGSTDGTSEFLKGCENIIAIEQYNCGGAGGFYTGMHYMYSHGYEWLWMMDDDGIPDDSQLENLLVAGEKHPIVNALVIDKETKAGLAFPSKKSPPLSVVKEKSYWEFVHPFNGTFMHRCIIEKIGFIKKEMFIWGDEEEYMLRARKFGFKPVTYTKAIHYHPHEKGKTKCAIPFVHKYFQVNDKPKNLCQYFYRNRGYIFKNYKNTKEEFKFLLYQSVYLLRTFKFVKLYKLYKHYFAGRRNEYV